MNSDERQCALEGCTETFKPYRKTQRYCSRTHAVQASNVRYRGYSTDAMSADSTNAISEAQDDDLIQALQQRGFRVDKPTPVEARVKLAPLKTTRYRLGVVSDPHLGSKFSQRTYLHEFFGVFTKEAVDKIGRAHV